MNSMVDLRLPEIIGLTILHSLWQITLLWILLVAVLKLWPKTSSAVRYALAIATLTLSVLTTGATAAYEWQSYNLREEISVMSGDGATQAIHTVYISLKQTLVSTMLEMLNAAAPILAWLWFAGLVVMGTRFGGSFFYLTKLRAPENLTAIPPAWEQELKRLSTALGLRCNVAMATSARISSPLTLGSLSPMILLPAGLLSGLSSVQIQAILVHELHHIKRRDYAINIAQAFVEVLLFYHPAVWHINHIIREERENCCDDQTLAFCGDPIAYACALIQIQETNILTKPILTMSVTGNTAGDFTNRIKRLFNIYPNPAQTRSKGLIAIGSLLVYLVIVLASANVSTAQQTPAAEQEKKTFSAVADDRNNTIGDIFSGETIPFSEQLILLDGKEITHQQMLEAIGSQTSEIHAINIQHADTTVRQQHIKLIVALDRTPLVITDATAAKSASTLASPLLVINGTFIDPSRTTIVMEKLDKNAITSMTVYTDQDAIDRFGDKWETGVMEITLKPGTPFEENADNVTAIPRVQVFPNSTHGPLNISFTPARKASPVNIVLVDSDGKVVKEVTNSTHDNVPTTLSLDVTGYKKGIYVLQINVDGTKSQHRVVVE